MANELDIIYFNRKVNELERLYRKIINQIFDENLDGQLVHDYRETKKKLFFQLISSTIHLSNTTQFAEVRKALQKLTPSDDPNIPNSKKFDESIRMFLDSLKSDLQFQFTPTEYDQLTDEFFYSWFSPDDFIDRLFSIQLLFLKTDKFPQEMYRIADEIRNCYAFHQTTAGFALCRTLFEIAIKDVYKKNNLHKPNSSCFSIVYDYIDSSGVKINRIENFNPTLSQRIEILTRLSKFSDIKQQLDNVRLLGNEIIHGDYIANDSLALEMIQKTFQVIQDIYERN